MEKRQALLGAWGTISVRFAVTGDLPENVMPPSAVHLVYALDMGVLAPAFLIAGVMLWRRMPWGSVLAVAVNASGAAYLAVLWAVGGFQADAGIAGTSWLSPVAVGSTPVSYTHLRAHETVLDLVCRLLLEKKNR